MEQADKQHNNNFDWLKEHQWQKGQSGNPNGRPKNTLKDYVREKFMKMTDEEKEQFLRRITPEAQWRMGEGNPHNTGDLTTGGKPFPIYGGQSIPIPGHNSDKEDISTDKED